MNQDPVYTDNFFLIKTEMNKTGNIDFDLVIDKAEIILLEAKDLRVLAYLTFAKTYKEGLMGFIAGLELLLKNLQQHLNIIHPLKLEVRIAALKWLDNQRLLGFIEKSLAEQNASQIQHASELIEQLNTLLNASDPSYPLLFGKLMGLLKPRPLEAATAATNNSTPIVKTSESSVIVMQPTCKTEADLRDLTRLQFNYLREQQQLIRAAAYARAFLWGNLLSLPPHENHLTRIPPLREESLNHLDILLKNGNFTAILTRCEELFFEPSGHVYLDLQYHAVQAAKQLQNLELAAYIEAEVKILLRRLPMLAQLMFEDNTPFASATCQAWIDQLLNVEKQNSNESKNPVDDINDTLESKTLLEKLKIVREIIERVIPTK